MAAVLVGRGEEIGKSELALRAATHSAEATVSFSLSLCFPRTARKPTGHENDPESVKRRVTVCGKKCLFFFYGTQELHLLDSIHTRRTAT